MIDTVITDLESVEMRDRPVCLRTPERGLTQHTDVDAALACLRDVLRERRAVRRPSKVANGRSSSRPARRRERSVTPFSVDVPDTSRMIKSQTCPGDLVAMTPDPADTDNEDGKGKSGIDSDAETRAPSPEASLCKKDSDMDETDDFMRSRRLREIQLVLDIAKPEEFVGLKLTIDNESGTVSDYADGRYRVVMSHGNERFLTCIEASHVAGCLPAWAC